MKKLIAQSRHFNHWQGWVIIGGKNNFYRSSWERKYAWHLQILKIAGEILDWEYEPETFWFESIKRGIRSYKPDFMVLLAPGKRYWVEVKGHMDSKSLTKIRRFARFYPSETLKIVDAKWFKKNCPIIRKKVYSKRETVEK